MTKLFNQFSLFGLLFLTANGLPACAGINQSNIKDTVSKESTISLSQNIEVKDVNALVEALKTVTPGTNYFIS